MENKKLGIVLIVISLVFALFVINANMRLTKESEQLNCISTGECSEIQTQIDFTNAAFGFFGFMLGLGFFMLFFNKTDEKIFKRLEDEKNKSIEEEKFKILSKALDESERKVVNAVREQDGITQNTLMLRANLSKAKLSYVLSELEKRNIIKRIPKGKTKQVFLKI